MGHSTEKISVIALPMDVGRLELQHCPATAFERGWSTLSNGDLIAAAEQQGFEVLVTTDQKLRNSGKRQVAVIVLSSASWPRIQKGAARIVEAIDRATPGSITK